MPYLKNENLIKTLTHQGILQEVNRSFFHPLGMALTIAYFADTEKTELRLQYTEDKEGFLFDHLDKTKQKAFWEYAQKKHLSRIDAIGTVIQVKGADDIEQKKKEKSLATKRFDIISEKLNEFVYSMRHAFNANHLKKDQYVTFLSEDEIFAKLADRLLERDWVGVANYSFMMEFYDILNIKISELIEHDNEETS
jgi:hypothetical protein